LSLTQLTSVIRCSKNKTFRLLSNLEHCGIVRRDTQSKYTIGFAAFVAARKIISRNTSLDSIRPCMKNVTDLVNESTYYACVGDNELLLVDYVDCCRPVKVVPLVGNLVKFPSVSANFVQPKGLDAIGDIMLTSDGFGPDVTAVIARIDNNVGIGRGALVVVAPSCRMQMERIKTEIVPALRTVLQRNMLSDLIEIKPVVALRMPVAFDEHLAKVA
jgi:DNA-binding IclR family transcriptional regulator